ncbi:MAG: hypothetical protein IJM06_06250, partial [Firmicutes bacterium]|nr:hypothetical protein [Bacillota bacterium]
FTIASFYSTRRKDDIKRTHNGIKIKLRPSVSVTDKTCKYCGGSGKRTIQKQFTIAVKTDKIVNVNMLQSCLPQIERVFSMAEGSVRKKQNWRCFYVI